jgi:alpha-glucosidase/alpha-D-xyloside xylohydrolase
MPIYVRAGTILPMDPVRQYTGQPVDEPTTIRIYPGAEREYRWYQDDGESLDYQEGEYSWIRLYWNDDDRQLTIEPDPESEGQAPDGATIQFKLMSTGEKKIIEWDGSQTLIEF